MISFLRINGVADFVNLYSFDNLGRMTQVVQRQFTASEQTSYGTSGTNTIQRKRANIEYNRAGGFSEIVRSAWIGTGDTEVATTEYSYFNGGGLKGMGTTHAGNLLGTPPMGPLPSLSSYQWTYDAAGRVDLFTAPEGVFDYGYDNTHQLTSAVFTAFVVPPSGGLVSESFDFDLTGNRNSQTVGGSTTTTTVDKNRLLSDGTYNYAYDAEGSRISRTLLVNGSPTGETINYTWDHRNRLTKAEFRSAPGGTITKIVVNSYDAFDRRVMKQVDANADGDFADAGDRVERYVWDGDDLVLVLDANGAVLHRFLHGPAIDQIFADESSVDGLLWYLTDNQGTVRDVINNSGTVVNHLTYSPFGKLTSESDPTKTPFVAYTAQDLDEDLGLQLHGKRWFDPLTGRWMSEDPIRFGAGDPNLQRYVGNGATNLIDPSGLDGEASNRLPSDERGIWLKNRDRNRLDSKPATRGDGWFHFKDKSLPPILYKDGRPDFGASGQIYNHNGRPAIVNIGPLESLGDDDVKREKHFQKADAEMRKRDPKWERRKGYTWHHSSTDGTMELVPEKVHKAGTHTGSIADRKAVKKQCAKPANEPVEEPTPRRTPSKPTSPTPATPKPPRLLPKLGAMSIMLDWLTWPVDWWRIDRAAEQNGRTFDEQLQHEIDESIIPGALPHPSYPPMDGVRRSGPPPTI